LGTTRNSFGTRCGTTWSSDSPSAYNSPDNPGPRFERHVCSSAKTKPTVPLIPAIRSSLGESTPNVRGNSLTHPYRVFCIRHELAQEPQHSRNCCEQHLTNSSVVCQLFQF